MYVQFTDDSQQVVLSVFIDPQNPEEYPNQGNIEESDPRYLAFISPVPEPEVDDPLAKLKAFLAANPDVAEILK